MEKAGTDSKKDAHYSLEHWRLHYAEKGVVAEGHLRGETGKEGGIEIRTSLIRRWRREEEKIVLYTVNSIYSCSLREYIPGSCSVSLLKEVECDTKRSVQEELDEAERELRRIEGIRQGDYREALMSAGNREAVILSWCGCDYPYLKRIVSCNEGRIEAEDIMRPVAEISMYINPVSRRKLSFRPENSDCAETYMPACLRGTRTDVLLQNEGQDPFTVLLSDGRRISVEPGAQVAADPVLLASNRA